LSAFLIELLGRLEQDPLDVIQDVLIYQTQMMRNSSLGPYVPTDFSPPGYIVVVNALFYASLGVIILAASIAMLIKTWIREFDRGLHAMSIPEQRAKTREFRYLGMERWKLPEMVGILPFLIQLSLLLFSIGLVILLFYISKPSCGVTTTILGIGILYYAMTTSISVVVSSSPFHSPLSRILAEMYQRLHAYLRPPVSFYASVAMDTPPATTLGRVLRHIQIFLQKSRPYLESDFEIPSKATTLDEVQLSTAASALRRIYQSVPNSQQHEGLHWSVWQVAGSTKLRVPPLFDLPSWIRNKWNDSEYLSHLPPSLLVALVAVSLRTNTNVHSVYTTILHAGLGPTRSIKGGWAPLVVAAVAHHKVTIAMHAYSPKATIQTEPDNRLAGKKQRVKLPSGEAIWLLSTLSELFNEGYRPKAAPYLVEICVDILFDHLRRGSTPSDILLESVVTLAAVSCVPDHENRPNITTSTREHPWLFLNFRNPALFGTWFEDTPPERHKPFISLLFLVVYALTKRQSFTLVDQYFAIITAKGDLPLYASALTTVAPAIGNAGLSFFAGMLVTPVSAIHLPFETLGQTQPLLFMPLLATVKYTVLENLLKSYDRYLGTSKNLEPSIFAIVLVLSKDLRSFAIRRLERLDLELRNPYTRLVARVIARLDIPGGSGLPMELCSDHRVNNMIVALSLLRYTEGRVTQYTESLLLASFLHSRELTISSVALEYYMKTAISHSDSSAPSSYLSRTVHAVFNPMLHDHQLQMGWRILETFVNGFDNLSMEWRRSFAKGFFTLSRQPLQQSNTPGNALENILTWEYFHKEKQESASTDSEFCGLHWMTMAWSLHLSQESRGVPTVNEEFVLRALHRHLDAVPDHQIIPIIPTHFEFIQWFDDADLSEYRRMISTRVNEAVRWHDELVLHKFGKFQCIWYI
jgi:hypothetical protein